MTKQKVKKRSLTSFSPSPRQPPPNNKVELEPSSPSSRQPPLPFSLSPPLALDSQPTVKTNPSSILGKAPIAHVGVHVSVGASAQKHKSGSATKTVVDTPPKQLASDEDMEEEESSSCGFDSCSNDSSDLGEDDDSVSLPSTANGAPSPSSLSALVGDSVCLANQFNVVYETLLKFCKHYCVLGHLIESCSKAPKVRGMNKEVPTEPLSPTALKRSKNSKGGRSVAREEQATETAVRAGGAALGSELLTSCVRAASVVKDEFEFDSFPSDPMCAEVATAVGEWEIIKNKNRHSINMKQAATMGDGKVAQ
ncbi:hypothetical protein SADUNF_Sadunf11G0060900 [Salix dunnii]|uniref:Uncharacterized protein n=1 Tax=Salix dunnii TaxID=1413687 RepID=A0A835JQD4_9ROSI|nr:hypothetical protein SADUNF_Sadunf11G0060900 [Salix dunnii]